MTPEQQDAVKRICKAAWESEQATGVPAALTASQCIFESAYLTRCPGNNCFGIKPDGHGTGTQYVITHEFLNGTWEQKPLAFETYTSISDCFNDHSRLLQSGVYQPIWEQYQKDKDLDTFIIGISRRYATDPNYAKNMLAEAHSHTIQSALQQIQQGTIS